MKKEWELYIKKNYDDKIYNEIQSFFEPTNDKQMKKKLFIEITIDQDGKSDVNVNSSENITDPDIITIIGHLRMIELRISNQFLNHINTQEQ